MTPDPDKHPRMARANGRTLHRTSFILHEGCKLEEELARATWLLDQMVKQLPADRDWLSPDIEREARQITENKNQNT